MLYIHKLMHKTSFAQMVFASSIQVGEAETPAHAHVQL